ncbi:NPCBM/NEW2 domain-containing protein [Deinococcus aquatilis]|uniref:NPCBM/NEW2 domain-containing protein n=1 Tax=Deinococcus aquatilis TaxID=519440 RepID=UPI0003A6BC2B|nr:NPCBM/NEW2 domain-containing protein [Deinococcus aquatilis]
MAGVTERRRKAARQRMGAGLMGLALGLMACSQNTPQTSVIQDDPYAGGQSYPWSDRLEPTSGDPYADGKSYPWTGVRASAPGLTALAQGSNDNFLSDLSWTSATNAWGPIEKDRSNGDKLEGDGLPITIGGQVFAKGLGVHAASEVSYALGGMCSVLTAQIGLDDEVGDKGTVVFQVWNGTTSKLYDSGTVRGIDAAKAISVNIAGVQNLRLVVTNNNDGISFDHADWADVKVSCPARQPSGENQLSDLPWTSATNSWGPVERDLSNGEKLQGDGKILTMGGVTFAKGLGVHASSTITYGLAARCNVFSAQVGVDDEVGSNGSVVFQVYGDGVKLYESPIRRGTDAALPISVPVSGVNELRLVATDGGNGISSDHADWADAKVSCTDDTTPPAIPGTLTAVPAPDGITLDWANNTEPDLAGYRVYRSPSAGGPFSLLTPQPITTSGYSDPAPEGVRSFYQVVSVDQVGNMSLPASANATRPNSGGSPVLSVENLDGVPFFDRLVFSRIGSLTAPPSNGVHERVTLRLKNTGSSVLRVSDLPISGPWVLDPAPTLPNDLAPGGFLDVRLRFVAEATKYQTGTLTVASNDSSKPAYAVQLAGLWQSVSEGGQEPNVFQLRDAFGYTLSLVGGEPTLDQKGLVRAQGDEVLSAYWQRADETQPVTVRQLAAYHTQGNTATLFWHDKRNTTSNTILVHAGVDAQTVLPRQNGSLAPSLASFTPAAGINFGFRIDGEWGDPRRNSQTADRNNGCLRPCGQHIRLWPAKDRAGVPLLNTYLMIMDYAGINYDYNDNLYLITNLKPAPILLNVGGATFTDPATGNVWLSDRDQNGDAPYTPTTAINEGNASSTYDILGTDNDLLYRTYRGNVGTSTPQESRQISFNIPVNNGTYLVKLHFADLAWTVPGKRIFDVSAEGVLRVPNLDIVAQSGGGKTALVVPIDNVQVTDGKLTLDLKASVDFPAISGIEIVR